MDFQKWLKDSRGEMAESLRGCVRIPSVYADDKSGYPYGEQVNRCLLYMLDLAGKMGFSTRNMDDRLGWCEYGSGDEMVAVLGHLDVVPEGEGWDVPPYEGLIKDGKIYGRGTMDDKGPTVAALYALKAIKDSKVPLKRRIRILFGLNEETGSSDMKYYLSRGGETPVTGFTPDGEYPVINGEKGIVTETYVRNWVQEGDVRLTRISGGTAHNIVPAHAEAELICSGESAREIADIKAERVSCTPTATGVVVHAEGVGAHGGTPEEGENAIGHLMLFLARTPLAGEAADAVRFLAEKIGTEYDGRSLGVAMEDSLSGALTMNMGVIRGDADGVEVKLNYRYPVTHTFDECGPAVRRAFQQAGFRLAFEQHKPRIYMPPEAPLVRKLLKVYSQYTGTEAQPKCIGGGTYAKMIPNILAFGPIFPGDEVREHKPNEFMELSRLDDNAAIFAAAMYELARE